MYHVQDSTRQGMAEAADLDAKLYNTYQYNNQSVTDYIDKYLSFVDSVHIYGGFSGAYTPRIPCVREVRQMRRCQRLRHNKQRDSSTAIPHCPPLPRVEQTEVCPTETEHAQQLHSWAGSHASILPGGTATHHRISQPAHHVWGRGRRGGIRPNFPDRRYQQ